jgi:hypothetical protein
MKTSVRKAKTPRRRTAIRNTERRLVTQYPRRRVLSLAAGAVAVPAVSRVAWAQAYPTRPVRLVVGFPAAGAADKLRQCPQAQKRHAGQHDCGTSVHDRAPCGYVKASVLARIRFEFQDDRPPWALTLPLMHRDFGTFLGNLRPPVTSDLLS